MTIALDHQDVLDAATAAAAVVPSSVPLAPSGAVTVADVTAALPHGAVAVVGQVAAAVPGAVLVIAEPELSAALDASPMGPLPLSEALRPALEALAATFGAGAIGEVTEAPAAQALADLAGLPTHTVVQLDGEGQGRAWVAVGSLAGQPDAPAAGFTPQRGASVPQPSAGRAAPRGLELLSDVVMELTAELGRTRMTVRDLLSLQPGAVVELDRVAGSPADLLVNGRLIARGEVMVVDEEYALKITELLSGTDHA